MARETKKPETEPVYFAYLDSEAYTWCAFGRTEEEAKRAIYDEWHNGRGCDFRFRYESFESFDDYYSIKVYNTNDLPYGKCEWC